MLNHLLLQGATHLPSTPPGHNGRSFRNSYWYGFTAEIGKRFYKIDQATREEQTQETALVLVDRNKQVRRWMDDNLNLRSDSGGAGASSAAGYGAGKQAGAKSSLGQSGLSSTRALGR